MVGASWTIFANENEWITLMAFVNETLKIFLQVKFLFKVFIGRATTEFIFVSEKNSPVLVKLSLTFARRFVGASSSFLWLGFFFLSFFSFSCRKDMAF